MNDITISDNALPQDIFQELQKTILSPDFPWYYARKTYDNEVINNPYLYGWLHIVFKRNQWFTNHTELFHKTLSHIISKEEGKFEIGRVRLVMNTTAPEPFLNGAHVDVGSPHKTALLYLNDSDGDTVLFNEFWETDDFIPPLTVSQTVSPKANRMVSFNGLRYHTGTLPTTTNRRIVLNVNYRECD